MTKDEQDRATVVPLAGQATQDEELPFRIELWDAAAGETVERVLARAISASLARAIFQAAHTEHPERRITLRRGSHLVADTRKTD
jgi:hypothetical protein